MGLPSLFRRHATHAFHPLARLQNELDRFLEDISENGSRGLAPDPGSSRDRTEDKSNHIMKFDKPGVAKEDVKTDA